MSESMQKPTKIPTRKAILDSDLEGIDADEKSFDWQLAKMLWSYAKPHKKVFIAATLLLPLVALVQIAQPFLVKEAIDGPIANKDFSGLLKISGYFFLLILFDLIFTLSRINE